MIQGTIQLLLYSLLLGVISQMVFDHLVLFSLLLGAFLLLLLAFPVGVLLLELGEFPLQLLPSRLRLLELMLKSPLLHRARRHLEFY